MSGNRLRQADVGGVMELSADVLLPAFPFPETSTARGAGQIAGLPNLSRDNTVVLRQRFKFEVRDGVTTKAYGTFNGSDFCERGLIGNLARTSH